MVSLYETIRRRSKVDFLLAIDNGILNFIQQTMSGNLLDKIMPMITTLGDAGAIWIVIGLVLLSTKKHRKLGITVLIALALCGVIGNLILKPWVARIRPFEANQFLDLLIAKPEDFSFPSGHTMSSFAAAVVIFLNNKKYGWAALILATVISFSRLYLYVHYPSDILIGLIIGVLIGIGTVKWIEQRADRETPLK